jgi:hypothetical protein
MIKWEREAKTPAGFEKVVKELKKNPDVDNPYAIAWSMKNRGIKPKAMNKPISEGDMTGLTSMSAKGDKGEAEFEVEKEKEGIEIEVAMVVESKEAASAKLEGIAKQIGDGYVQGTFFEGEWELNKEEAGAAEVEPEKKDEEPIQEEGSY